VADISQYNFTLKEITIALVKEQGIRSGKWTVGFEFGMGAGNFATSPTEVLPAAFVGIRSLVLMRVKDGDQPVPYEVDAAEVNLKAGP
jgi:hypothetical protein